MQHRGRPNRQPRRGDSNAGRRGGTYNHNNGHQPRQQQQRYAVPSQASITPGSGVSIILKADQPTGHRVTGIVADVLTRADHPRGVKVRLRDGRVGRVQAIVSEIEGEAGESLVGGSSAGLGRNGEVERFSAGARERRRGGRIGSGVEENDEYLFDETRLSDTVDAGLFSALEEADRRHAEDRGWSGESASRTRLQSEIFKCPVCGDFEGDETAVAFHVESHFKD